MVEFTIAAQFRRKRLYIYRDMLHRIKTNYLTAVVQ